MPDQEQQSFQDLFDAEPSAWASDDASTWVYLYESLVAMMERQLDETRAFAMRAPDAMKRYLGRENIAILEEEIAAFKDRLAHWRGPGTSPQ